MLELKIAKPCNQSWTAMRGDERVRHCGACRKNVYNVSEMTEKEVEELVQRTEGHFCARIYRRSDQRVMTADCPKGVARVRRKRTLAVTAVFAAVAAWPIFTPTFVQGAVKAPRHNRAKPPVEPAESVEFITGKARLPDVRLGQIVVVSKRAKAEP